MVKLMRIRILILDTKKSLDSIEQNILIILPREAARRQPLSFCNMIKKTNYSCILAWIAVISTVL